MFTLEVIMIMADIALNQSMWLYEGDQLNNNQMYHFFHSETTLWWIKPLHTVTVICMTAVDSRFTWRRSIKIIQI